MNQMPFWHENESNNWKFTFFFFFQTKCKLRRFRSSVGRYQNTRNQHIARCQLVLMQMRHGIMWSLKTHHPTAFTMNYQKNEFQNWNFPFCRSLNGKKEKKKNASGGQSDGQQLLIQPMALLLQFNSNFVRPVSKLYANHMQIPPKRPYEGEERGKKIPSGFEQFSSFPKIIPFISCKFMQISSSPPPPPQKKNQLSAELWLFRLLSPFSPQSPHSAHFAK